MFMLVSAGSLMCCCFLMMIWKQQKTIIKLDKKIDQFSFRLNQHQLEQSAVVNADLFFGKQLSDINRQLLSMDQQLQSLENKRDNDGGYQHALRILEMGGDKAEILESCHLSNAEADLILNLQAYRAAIKKK